MSRTQRRKDVVAAVLIIGTAILYWTSGGRDDIPGAQPPERQEPSSDDRPARVTELPGFGSEAD
ncbi:MAG: hypothetical protein ED559_07560 [Phycisphaera sp.]|nr:MAG: hypothetical protein ED559_07560 [Phycisphaera sp.]